ncbi:TEER-decreasing protein [Mycena maculata]|uniref:TEER-decreasing protein n=1 Tax=Mycena maculata TaxID=230809 RepID=A0AAD7NC72_9AGAR|nr:TEER-decreasing protein [Mycena maculata]
MSGPGPKTTWEDLANLGWYKQQAYDRFNSWRGGTMEGLGDMALNEGFANDYGWYSYNVLIGSPRIAGNSSDNIESSSIVWMYDNSQNLQEFTATWTETWTNSVTASLSISTHAGISLSQSISIPGVGGSEFSIEISTDSTKEETKQSSHQLSTSWGITVLPGETVYIERVRMVTTGQAIYNQDYGLSSDSLVATKGRIYEGHYYWGMYINETLNYPSGTMSLVGRSTEESYTFRIVRQKPDGRREVEYLPPPEGKSTRGRLSGESGATFPKMVPGIEKKL